MVQAVDIFALALFLSRARAATGLHVVPSQVTITHRPPPRAQQLTRFCGTDRIHFDAPYNSIGFSEDDVRAPLAGPGRAVRHEHTRELLRTTDLPGQSIAGRVGYSDVRALRRAVRRWEGHTPREVRRNAAPAPSGAPLGAAVPHSCGCDTAEGRRGTSADTR
ncbi:helix-turn-helix domain-containing protein [Streptomyces sp. MSC1_001]|uniref:helix-turn-helix domain-containing protein n=1 Tax=Streptomyces sp. MSC1_001 TaxID=2909263 RepID=UPI002030AED5|nr:helix-turn-helix domain-containing protein [Streptomyces sp. MSC1_001]